MIIKLMDNKPLTDLLTDQTNGLGKLPEVTEAIVSEERNGLYDLSFTIPNTAEHFDDIANGSVVKAKVADGSEQMFRVYQMTKQMNGLVTVDCHHVTYDLNKAPVSPFSSTGASASARGLINHLMASYPFYMSTDITDITSQFILDIPRSFRECLGGYSGSLLDVFGGEYEWNNLEVILHAHRGVDKGVRIAYGKNLTDLEQEENIEAVYDAVLGYATSNEQTYNGSIVYANGVVSNPKVLIVDFSSKFSDEEPSSQALDDLAAAYIQDNQIGTPKVSISVEFAPLWQSPEYSDLAVLESVNLCDTVHVYYPKLNVEASAKVIATEWDVINERYNSIELGDARTTLDTAIVSQAAEETKTATGFLDSYINGITQIIANGLGLFTTRVPSANGGTLLYLHNRPTLAESQYQWTINSGGFAVSQDYGQTWSVGIDAEGNAVFNSLAANTIRALTIEGSTIYSGDQYWYHGTANEGLMDENTVTYDGQTYSGVKLTATAVGIMTDGGTIVIRDYTDQANDVYSEIVLRPNGGVYIRSSVGAFVGIGNTGTITLGSGDGYKSVMVSNSEIAIRKAGSPVTNIILNSNGLSIQAGGSTRSNLGFVDDGNGHWVLGVSQ